MGEKAKGRSNALPSQSFEHLMKCQPLMDQVIALAEQNNLECVYMFSDDWDQEAPPSFSLFSQDKVPVENEKLSYSLVFKKINFGAT